MGDVSAAGSAWRYHDSERGRGVEGWNLDDAPADVLPDFPVELLADALQRLSPEDRQLALRHKIVAIAFLPGMTLYACVTAQAKREALSRGLRIVARIRPSDYRRAVRHVLGPQLLKQAVFQLASTRPLLSARHRLWPTQVLAVLLLALVLFVAAVLSDPGYVALAVSVAAGCFFAMTVAIRIFALTPLAVRAKPQRDDTLLQRDLPIYTVLVPLFRETAVLNQLLGGLMALNYPVLCTKRTKSDYVRLLPNGAITRPYVSNAPRFVNPHGLVFPHGTASSTQHPSHQAGRNSGVYSKA